MEAQVTIKLTPREFDVMRDALTEECRRLSDDARATATEAPARVTARKVSGELSDLLKKLR